MSLPILGIPEANLQWYGWVLNMGKPEMFGALRNISSRSLFKFFCFVNGKLLWFYNINLIKKTIFLLCDVSEHYIVTLNWNITSWRNIYLQIWVKPIFDIWPRVSHKTIYIVKANPKYLDFLFHTLLW